MKVNYVKLTAGVLTGFMALSSVPYAVYAAGPTAGVASYTSDIVGSSNTLTAGVTSMLTDIMLKGDQTSETATDVAATEAEPVKSAYADTAVAQVNVIESVKVNGKEYWISWIICSYVFKFSFYLTSNVSPYSTY